jgi:hypothetical protein
LGSKTSQKSPSLLGFFQLDRQQTMFEKTRTRRQSELTGLVLQILAFRQL